MEIKPTKDSIIKAMNLRTEYLRLIFINIVLLIFTLFILVIGRYIISLLAIMVCFGCEIYICYQRYQKNKKRVTDISDAFINLEDEYISCYQASDNCYENCDILISEITSVIEDTKDIGFYIVLNDDSNLSTILVDNVRTDRRMFYISGYAYEKEEFIELFEQLLVRLENADVQAYKTHNSWKTDSSDTEYKKLYFPWAFICCLGLIHIAITLFLGA